jgi:predicted transcriptional regulator
MSRIRRPKHTIEQIRKAFEKEGYKLLEKEYKSNKQLLKYKCKCGKIRVIIYNNFSRGIRCKLCYLKRNSEQWAKSRKRTELALVLREQHYSIPEVADILGVPYEDFYKPVSLGLLPSPTRKIPGRIKPLYNSDDIEKIRDLIHIEVRKKQKRINGLLNKKPSDNLRFSFPSKKTERLIKEMEAKEANQKAKMKILFDAKKKRLVKAKEERLARKQNAKFQC